MRFVKKVANTTPIEDTVFVIVEKAAKAKQVHGADKVVDATIGSLFNEEGGIVAFDSVFTPYNAISKEDKAKYADSFTGNDDYREQVYQWLMGDVKSTLAHSVIATPGGTGAVNLTIEECLDVNETLIIPEIAWGSYSLMATMSNVKTVSYSLFEGNHFHIDSFKKTCEKVLETQDKLVVIINDPCHNPTGYSLTYGEWEEIISFLNECSKKAAVVVLNDVAYIDYAYDIAQSRKYMETFNAISDNVMMIVAFSCSKSLTSYGLRCGGALICANHQEAVRSVEVVFEKAARAMWSNIPNAAMENFTYVTTTNKDAYMQEKAGYVDLLKQRSDLFIKEANEVGLPMYPYKEGFFVSVEMKDNDIRNRFHEALMEELIFTVKVNKGIRVAVCSLSVPATKGLAVRMKEILDEVTV